MGARSPSAQYACHARPKQRESQPADSVRALRAISACKPAGTSSHSAEDASLAERCICLHLAAALCGPLLRVHDLAPLLAERIAQDASSVSS